MDNAGTDFSINAGEAFFTVILDKILSQWNPDLSRSFFQKLIKDGQILVNDIPRKANYRVEEGDTISVTIPEPQNIEILPENISLDIRSFHGFLSFPYIQSPSNGCPTLAIWTRI